MSDKAGGGGDEDVSRCPAVFRDYSSEWSFLGSGEVKVVNRDMTLEPLGCAGDLVCVLRSNRGGSVGGATNGRLVDKVGRVPLDLGHSRPEKLSPYFSLSLSISAAYYKYLVERLT